MSGDTTLLFVTQVAPYLDGPAGVHGVLDQAAVGLAQVAELHGLRARRVEDVRELDDRALAEARALALFTIGETPWSSRQRVTVVDRVRAGALAVVAIHSATDSCYAWEEYGSLVGARFDGHPWTQEVALDVLEHAHPATRHLPPSWRWYDEVYQFRDLRPDARVLLRVPESQLDPAAAGAKQPSFGYPLSWCFAEGAGRSFSTSLGHFPGAWETPAYLRHLAGGLAWALGEGA
jgi:type 1 glutamine amidotransferase